MQLHFIIVQQSLYKILLYGYNKQIIYIFGKGVMNMRVLLLMLAFFAFPAAADGAGLEEALDGQIKEYGVFDGDEGILYAAQNTLAVGTLMTVRFYGGELCISVFDAADGCELTDELCFPLGGENVYRLSVGSSGSRGAVILVTNGVSEGFVLQNDTLERTYRQTEERLTLAEYRDGKMVAKTNDNVFEVMKELKGKQIRESEFYNAVGELSPQLKTKIRELMCACADVMSFDKNDYDVDKTMRYILCTHKNFAPLTDILPDSVTDGAEVGSARISQVSEEFVEYITENVFGFEAPKPAAGELVAKGYYCSGGRYYYREMFNIEFATEIRDIIAVNRLGGGVYYVVFSDVYTRGGKRFEEYSFAVVRENGDRLRLLRLGMGEPLLSDKEIAVYAPLGLRNNHFYSELPSGERKTKKAAAAVLIAAAAIFAAVVIIRKIKH